MPAHQAGSTIAALATAPGTPGDHPGRAVIRLSGPDTADALAALLDDPPNARGAFRRTARMHPHALPVLVLRFLAPASYTGEDAAEIVTVSNRDLTARLLDRLTALPGVRLAGPGEFTARAYLAGRLTLAQAEGVAMTIAAETDDQLAAADRLLSGSTGQTYHAWADRLASLLALVEAGVDFTDQEDVVPIPPRDLADALGVLRAELGSRLAPRPAEERPGHPPRVVLAGPPNAGKSTLFNTLLARPRAVVSDRPGTTRDALEETLALPPSPFANTPDTVTLVDLAGLDRGPGVDPLDSAARALARSALDGADCVLHCDPAGRFDALPTLPAGTPVLRLRTKADLPAPGRGDGDLAVCALDGYHLDALRRAIADAVSVAAPASSAHASVVPRHQRALRDAAAHLAEALASIDPGDHALAEPELVAGELRLALNALAELAGDVTPDDVLGRVFASFCIGK
ncbi:MAG: GTPase [Phycisphaerales bacterium JB040]